MNYLQHEFLQEKKRVFQSQLLLLLLLLLQFLLLLLQFRHTLKG